MKSASYLKSTELMDAMIACSKRSMRLIKWKKYQVKLYLMMLKKLKISFRIRLSQISLNLKYLMINQKKFNSFIRNTRINRILKQIPISNR